MQRASSIQPTRASDMCALPASEICVPRAICVGHCVNYHGDKTKRMLQYAVVVYLFTVSFGRFCVCDVNDQFADANCVVQLREHIYWPFETTIWKDLGRRNADMSW